MSRRGCTRIPNAEPLTDQPSRSPGRAVRALAVAALCLGLFASPASAQWAAPDLFPDPPVPTDAGPHGLEALEGVIDTAPALRGLGRLRMQLPGSGMVQMARDGFERRRDGDVTWRGRIAGEEGSRVILTVKDGYMAGRILHGIDEYEIRPGPGRSHVIERVDTSVEHDEYLIAQSDGSTGPTGDFLSTTTALMAGDTADNIQLLVTYTPMAREGMAGTERMEVLIQSLVDRANTAFIDSGMTARFALVHTAEVPFVETDSLSNIYNAVEWLQTRADVSALRDRYGADMVSIIVLDNGRCEGVAYVMRDPGPAFESMAYQATSLNCSGTTFAHEHGHNMGFEHDPANAPPPADVSYPWSYGHFVDGVYRTVMSYGNQCSLGCPRAMQFSNPNIVFQGAPTGIADERDNARTGELTAPIVAAFRPAVTGAVVNRSIAASAEDVEETYDGTIYADNPTLELGGDTSGIQAVGLRFQNLNIPQGVIIESAYLGFEAAVDGANAMTLVDIRAEAADNAPPFSTAAFDVTNRPATLASVTWDIPDWPWANQKRFSPDISAVIQELVDRPGWIENNSMVLTISGTGVRTALSYDGQPASGPLLHVEYTFPGDPPPVNIAPSAHFSYGCGYSEHCTFADLSIDVDGTIAAWNWDFGDLSTSTAQHPAHSYAAAGSYTVTLTVTDNGGAVDSVFDTLVVASLAPVATDNAYTTNEDTAVGGNVLSDGTPDSDPEGASLSVVANTNPSLGVLSINSTGKFTYTPNFNFVGTDSFDYTVSDYEGGRATATVTVTVNPVNDPPVATNNSYVIDEDVAVSGNLLTDGTPDSDIDGDTLSATIYYGPLYDGPSHGSVTLSPDGAFTYTPNPDYTGQDFFAYTVSDGNGGTDIAGVAFSMRPVNDAPAAVISRSCVNLDCAFIDASRDIEGAITAWSWSFGDGATSSVQNPSHSYSAVGTYTVNLSVTDGEGATDTATAFVTVDLVNDTPVAAFDPICKGLNCTFNDTSTDSEGVLAAWSWSFGDGATSIAQNPTHSYAADGTYTVSLTVTDGQGITDAVTRTVTVVNTAPIATDNAYTTAEDVAVSGNVLLEGTSDSDADGDALTVMANTNPLSGTVTIAANGTFTYTPNADFNGTDGFTYTVSDGTATTTATVTITVTPVNDRPVATSNAYTTDEDVAVSGNVLTDGTPDSDPENDPLTVTAVSDPLRGAVTMAANGAFTFSPHSNFNGTDRFSYSVSDGIDTATGAVTITVISVNDVPVAAFGHSCSGRNCAYTNGSRDADDVDINLSWSWSFGDGAVSTLRTPEHSYTADGTYTVSLTVTDDDGATDTASHAITVTNAAPVATANSYTTDQDVAVSGNVLTDGTPDSDPDGDALTVAANTNPTSGTVTMDANGAFTYMPNADFSGADSFAYTVSDGIATDTASVTITVNPLNNAPVAAFSHSCTNLNCVFTDGSTDIEGPLAAWSWAFGDGAVSTVQNPTHAYAVGGTYTVSLTVTDGQDGTDTATQAVTAGNTAPVATANDYSTNEDVAVSGNVLTDGTPDSDVDGDPLTVTANTSPLSGSLTVAANGAFTYTPNADFNGTDSFTYTVSDGIAAATAAVTITINPVSDSPVATDDAYTTDEDVVLSGNVITDGTPDSDADGDNLTVTANSTPLSGTVTVATNGAFTYTPNADFSGSDSFTYTVSDGTATATATVTVTVTSVNDAPVAAFSHSCAGLNCIFTDGSTDIEGAIAAWSWSFGDGTTAVSQSPAHSYAAGGSYTVSLTVTDDQGATDTVTQAVTVANTAPVATGNNYTTDEDVTLSGNVLLDGTPDSDADGDALTVTANTNPANGTVAVAANGAFTYTPNADFNGTDSFTYTVSDGLLTATATVTVTVSPVNDAPVAAFSENCTDLDCVFTDGSTDIDGAIVSWSWSFHFDELSAPDQSTLQNPSYSFPGVNEYLVSLTVTDSDGASAEASKYVVLNIDNYPPVAGFAYNCSGLSCSFMDMSTDAEGAMSGWSWEFGDGATSTLRFPEHDYATAGSYAVTMTVTDTGGKTDTTTQTLTVNSPPVATANAYTTSEDVVVSGNVLTDGTPDSDADGDALTVTANTAPLSGTVTVAANGAFTYTPNADFNGSDSFTYTVSDGTATATATVSITVTPVNDAPVAAFSHGCSGLNCAFTDGSTDIDGAIAAWSWSFGDGATSTLQSPTHSYAADGAYTVSLTVTDGAAAAASTTQAVTVANTAPVATNDAYTTAEDVALSGNVLLDGVADSDVDGDALTVTANTSSLNGAVTVAGNGAFTYTPNTDFNGTDSFIYTVSDGTATATATVSITVTPVNDAPVATDNTYATAEDVALSGNALTDSIADSDADGDALTVLANTSPLNGTVTVAANGAFTYTPVANFNGSDSFTYTVSDGLLTATATIFVTVNPVNDTPVATADAYATAEDTAVNGNVLFDGTPDSDADGDALTVMANTSPLNGTVTVATTGAFTYTPNADFNGADSFAYTVSDGFATATATVTLTVTPVNDAPVAAFSHGCAGVNCTFTDGSTDIEGAIAAWSWSFGDGAVSAVQSPSYSYAAEGTYTVSLTVTDGAGATATATQAVTVANTPPVATDNAYTTDEDVAVSGNVLTDGVPDSDADGDTLTVLDTTAPLGTLSTNADGSFTYTPPSNFNGTDTFKYSVIDGISGGATGTVTITVNPVNDAPVAAFTHDCLGRGCTFTDGSSDVEGPIAAWAWDFGDGAVSTAPNPVHSYAADGTYTVSMTVTDGQGATNTVSQAVIAVNTAPVATADAYVTNEDTAVSGNVLTDGTPDSDADGDALTVTASSSPLNGAVTVAASGAFTYTPNADFNGSDSFAYTIGDGNGGSATATVTVTVTPVNDGPVASFGFACTDLDCVFTDASTDIDGTIASWSWDFGDGATAAVQSPAHSYIAVDATYTVTLTVTDDLGASDTAVQTVTVVNPFPPAAPANLTAVVTSTGNGSKAILSVNLNWTDTAINEESFVIERCEIQGGGSNATCVFAPVAEIGAGTTAYAEDLAMGSYRYRVKARNRNGDSGYSNVFEILKQQV